MIRILSVLNRNNKSKFVIKGFNAGFKSNGCYVLEKDYRDLQIEDIETFSPQIIFGYDYGFLMSENEELKEYIIKNADEYKLVHYFADEPDGELAYLDKPKLYEKFKKINAVSFVCSKEYQKQIADSVYLPLAVNAKSYKVDYLDKIYDISFVGRPLSERRQRILAALVKTFGKRLNIFSYERHFLQSLDDMKERMLLSDEEMETYKNSYRGFLSTEKELAQIYQSSKININITLQGTSGLNYRVFEIPASFGFLLTDYKEELKQTFDISRDIETYTDEADLIDKVKFYIKNQDIAEKIAINGFSKVTKKHSFTARANMLLGAIGYKNV